MPVTADRIESALRAAFGPDASIAVIDDSHRHAGHAGAGEGSHWRVAIRAAAMAGQGRVGRHRLVYDALRPLIDEGIHALAIDAKAPTDA